MNLKQMCSELEKEIEQAYTAGVTMEEAEKLAAKFLAGQLLVSGQLTKVDLDSRMRRSGLKAVRAGSYMDVVNRADKKPTEAQLSAIIDTDEIVIKEQLAYDNAEVEKAELERYYDIFLNGHIYMRSVAKGSFNG